jgi:hypothetical protein
MATLDAIGTKLFNAEIVAAMGAAQIGRDPRDVFYTYVRVSTIAGLATRSRASD